MDPSRKRAIRRTIALTAALLLASALIYTSFSAGRDELTAGQLLKVAGVVDSGGEAKALIADGQISVNGEVETRRGRQLHAGDELAAGDETLRLV